MLMHFWIQAKLWKEKIKMPGLRKEFKRMGSCLKVLTMDPGIDGFLIPIRYLISDLFTISLFSITFILQNNKESGYVLILCGPFLISLYSALQKNSFFLAIPYVNEVTLRG